MNTWSGKSLGKYEVGPLLGRGGMADVYRGVQPSLARTVAIKIIHPHLAATEDFIDRFRREARLVAGLRHPNIVQVIDFDVHEGVYYMVMEFIDGETLDVRQRRLQATGQRMALDEAQRVLTALCDAVEYAHQQGAVHRDLKPSNVMFTSRGQPVLTDFGIAKIVGLTGMTMTGQVSGTPLYMAPEQAQGAAVDGRADIYSLGVMLYEWLTGQVPFEGDTPFSVIMKHVTQPPPPVTRFNPSISLAIQSVVMRALAKDPRERFPEPLDLARAFARARTENSPAGDAATATPAAPGEAPSAAPDAPLEPAAPPSSPADSAPALSLSSAVPDAPVPVPRPPAASPADNVPVPGPSSAMPVTPTPAPPVSSAIGAAPAAVAPAPGPASAAPVSSATGSPPALPAPDTPAPPAPLPSVPSRTPSAPMASTPPPGPVGSVMPPASRPSPAAPSPSAPFQGGGLPPVLPPPAAQYGASGASPAPPPGTPLAPGGVRRRAFPWPWIAGIGVLLCLAWDPLESTCRHASLSIL